MKDEIWFEKWLWSYMPCHWKGVAFMLAMMGLIVLSAGIIHFICGVLDLPIAEYLDVAAFLIVLLIGSRIADRHSRKMGKQ